MALFSGVLMSGISEPYFLIDALLLFVFRCVVPHHTLFITNVFYHDTL